jgi:hypothetical protein
MPPWPVPEALNLPGIGLDGGQQVLHRLVRRVGAHLDAGRIGVHQPDGRVRRAGELGQALPVHHADLDGGQADRVAVGRGRRDRRVADDAAAAGAVDHGHGLAEFLLHQAAEDARGGIGAAAGPPGHDQRDRTGRVVLRGGGQGRGGQGHGGKGAGDQGTAGRTGHARVSWGRVEEGVLRLRPI